nr:protochlorophyllide-dependent translocon component 52, chloroplastic-like [Ipomoea trifida]
MDALKASTFQPFHFAVNSTTLPPIQFHKPNSPFPSKPLPSSPLRTTHSKAARFKLFTAISPDVSTEAETEGESREEKFDWYAQWYPVMPLCDLDKRRPHGKRILGIDVVVWWDRNEGEWKVMDDACPHRLAPLSEGRIDQWGRLQCVYHGWCFSGSGDFSLEAKGISFRYEVLIENLMDPAHADREGGKPLEISLMQLDVNGFTGKQLFGGNIFAAPCVYYGYYTPGPSTTSQSTSSPKATEEKPSNAKVKRAFLVFYCVPVSPGNSRLIFASPRNFAVWIDKVVPRWMFHIGQNLILDSDLYLLHVECKGFNRACRQMHFDFVLSSDVLTNQHIPPSLVSKEHKLKEIGPYNWHKSCFVPTKADTLVVAFRRWLNKYAGGQVDWRGKFSGALPQMPPREQLMDRYWSHTVKCSSCNAAYKSLNVLEVALQVISIASIGIVAAAKQGLMSVATRNTLIAMAVLCFLASRWLSHFTYKTFRFHDYDHAFR